MRDLDFGAYLERAARLFPDRVAVVCEAERLTYRQLLVEAASLASGFAALGLQPGDRVVDMRDNAIDSVIFEYGIAMARLVRVPLTPRLMPAEIPKLIAATGARAMCTTADHAELAASAEVEFVIADGLSGALSRKEISRTVDPARVWARPDDLFALRHTGGTTGVPKAAMQSHAAWISTAMAVLLDFVDLHDDDLMLQTQPYSHGGGLYTLPAAMRGAALVLQPRFDADSVLEAIDEYGVTVMKIVPTILFRLLDAQRRKPRNLSTLRLIGYGAAPMPESLLREAFEVFECDFSQTYGQAEAPGTIACLGVREHRAELKSPGTLLKSVGRPYPQADVVIVGENDRELAPGEVGEVTVGGNFVTTGYWQRPEATAKLLAAGRVHTGDVGYLADGYLYLVGRQNDVIISGGFNVYPPEVEDALLAVPGVIAAAVTSVPDLEWGDRVIAAVVADDGSELTADDVQRGCRAQVAGYKTPKEIRFVSELPMTANNKVDRNAVRALFTDNPKGGSA